MGWLDWEYTEAGALIGFFLGIIILIIFYYFNILNTPIFCLGTLESQEKSAQVCIRYNSLFPFILLILGALVGAIIKKVKG